jgi:lipid-A-disaccharide synthase
MIVLFKFEEEFYKREGIDVDFVGHPLLDLAGPTMDKEEFRRDLGFPESKTTIALLPGSRKQEIKHILPVMLRAVNLVHKKRPDIQLVVAKSAQVDWDIYKRIAGNSRAGLKIIEGQTYDCLNIADFCLVASGTATLETAIMQKPFAIIYKLGLLNYLLYRPQIRVPYIGMVNIVAGKMIVPEFIQFRATAGKIAAAALQILNNPSRIKEIKEQLSSVKSSLGEKGASMRAARLIVDFLNH